MKLIIVGLIVYSLLIGILCGMTSSPVVGGLVSSLFAVILAGIGVAKSGDLKFEDQRRYIGLVLIVMPIGIGVGLSAGVYAKMEHWESTSGNRVFNSGIINDGKLSFEESSQWVLAEIALRQRGIKDREILSLYDSYLRFKEENPNSKLTGNFLGTIEIDKIEPDEPPKTLYNIPNPPPARILRRGDRIREAVGAERAQ